MIANIRLAHPDDAPTVAELLGQLGYPATAADVRSRLRGLAAFGHSVTFVAEADGRVGGVATGHVFPALHSATPVAWLTSLVVSDRQRNAGLGRLLAEAVEAWARGQGAVRLSLTSANHRHAAHAFYEHIGYERTGQRLAKKL